MAARVGPATLALIAGSWVVARRQMHGLDVGAATAPGALGSFVALWVPMMAAMMLPAAIPAIVRGVGVAGIALAAPRFVGSYFRRLDSRRPGRPLGHVPVARPRATRAK